MKRIYLNEISLEELKELFVCVVREELNKTTIPINSEKEYLSRKQVAAFLNLSLGSLAKYVRNGNIPAKRLGNKVFFLKSDVEASLRTIKTVKHSRSREY